MGWSSGVSPKIITNWTLSIVVESRCNVLKRIALWHEKYFPANWMPSLIYSRHRPPRSRATRIDSHACMPSLSIAIARKEGSRKRQYGSCLACQEIAGMQPRRTHAHVQRGPVIFPPLPRGRHSRAPHRTLLLNGAQAPPLAH